MSRVSVLVLAAVPFIAAACGRIGYDPVQANLGGSGMGGGGAGAGGTTGTGTAGTSGTAGTGAAGTSGAGSGGSGISDGGTDLTPPNDASGPPATCNQAGSPTRLWSFGADVEGWALSGTGTMVWTGAIGDPGLGALQVDWGGGMTTHPRFVGALGNLTGRIVTAEIWVDVGSTANVKLFVQTGTRQVWADGGLVTPTPGQWTCLALDIDNPVFSRQQYDPTDVQIVGLELGTSGTSRVYMDQVGY